MPAAAFSQLKDVKHALDSLHWRVWSLENGLPTLKGVAMLFFEGGMNPD